MSIVMPAGSGGLVLSVSRKMMGAVPVGVSDEAIFEIGLLTPRKTRTERSLGEPAS